MSVKLQRTTPNVSADCDLSEQMLEREQAVNQSQSQVLPVRRIDLINSLQHSERGIFHSTMWENHCLPAIHPVFQALTGYASRHPMLRDYIIALYSCNFGRLCSDKRDCGWPNGMVQSKSYQMVRGINTQASLTMNSYTI